MLLASHAAAPYANKEAENGSLTGAATSQTDSSASGGHYVSFGTTSTQANCLQETSPETTTTAATYNISALEDCGFPAPCPTTSVTSVCSDTSPWAVGVTAGTTLSSVSAINCGPNAVSNVYYSGSVNNVHLNSGCTLTNSRINLTDGSAGEAFLGPGDNVKLVHDEISGGMTGTACTNPFGNTLQYDGANSVSLNYSYIHCDFEGMNYNVNASNSFITSDGPCSYASCNPGSDPHYEAWFEDDGDITGAIQQHDVFVNPNWQTAGIFINSHFNDTYNTPNMRLEPIENVTVNNSLIGSAGANGAIAAGCTGLSGAEQPSASNVFFTNNRLANLAEPAENSVGNYGNIDNDPGAMTWTNNVDDATNAQVPASGGQPGCG